MRLFLLPRLELSSLRVRGGMVYAPPRYSTVIEGEVSPQV